MTLVQAYFTKSVVTVHSPLLNPTTLKFVFGKCGKTLLGTKKYAWYKFYILIVFQPLAKFNYFFVNLFNRTGGGRGKSSYTMNTTCIPLTINHLMPAKQALM